MKVALVTRSGTAMTGLRRYALSLYDPLLAGGLDLQLAHPRPPMPSLLAAAWRLTGFDLATFFDSYPVRISLDGPDVCHLTSQTLATLLLTSRLPPTVVSVLDIIPYLVRKDERLSTYRHGVERLFDRLSLRALRRAPALIAISAFTKQTIVEHLHYPAERIYVIHCAVDRQIFRPQDVPPALLERYELDPGRPYVLYVGSEDPRKNVAGLIRAFSLVHRQLPAVQLVKVGGAHFAEERGRLLALVERLGLGPSVRFLNQVRDADLPLLYNAAAAFVLPSFYEGFGLPLLEAMSCGTPVIAANRASLPEVIGGAGPLVDPDDVDGLAEALVHLLSDAGRRADAGEAALARADSFSLATQAEATRKVYESLA